MCYILIAFIFLEQEKKPDKHELGILQYYGLDDWRWGLPVGLVVAVPLISHQVDLP
jgi:hypothetical protein